MAEFWRVESRRSGVGPYQCNWYGADELARAHDAPSSARPTPWEEDALVDAFEAEGTVCGSVSAAALAWWFEGLWSHLAEPDLFVVVAYDDVECARSSATGQAVMFDYGDADPPVLVMSVREFVDVFVCA
jgi:hypothetical protein